MRENETRIGGAHWGMFSIFEPGHPRPNRVIDQSVVAWRLASKATGAAGFDNPRTVQQQKFGLETSRGERIRYTTLNHELFNVSPYDPEELMIPIIHRRRSASELRMEREENRRSGLRYPSPEEVAEIQRRFHNPELQAAMELVRCEYLARMTHLISEPAPPVMRYLEEIS